MTKDKNSLTRWMKGYLAVLIGESSETVDVNEPLSYFDLDSIDAVVMASKLEDEFELSIHPETFLDAYASILELSERIFQNNS